MLDNRAIQIAQLRQSIASSEETQRQTGLDLSVSIAIQQRLLARLEQEPSKSISSQSGGVDVMADQVAVAGDFTGRDKIESNTQTVNAPGSVALNHSTVQGNIVIGPATTPALDDSTALTRYLTHVIESNRRLQLQGIRSSSGLVSIELEEIYITLTATERTHDDG